MRLPTKCKVRINLRSMVRSEGAPPVLRSSVDEGVLLGAVEISAFSNLLANDRRLVDHNPGIDMSKPRLQLIHCSNDIPPRAKHRQHGRSFRPVVIHGGARARSAPRESSLETVLKLINLGFLVHQLNYLAFLQASLAALESHNWTDPEKSRYVYMVHPKSSCF